MSELPNLEGDLFPSAEATGDSVVTDDDVEKLSDDKIDELAASLQKQNKDESDDDTDEELNRIENTVKEMIDYLSEDHDSLKSAEDKTEQQSCKICSKSYKEWEELVSHYESTTHGEKYLTTQISLGFDEFANRYADVPFNMSESKDTKGAKLQDKDLSPIDIHLKRTMLVKENYCNLCAVDIDGDTDLEVWKSHIYGELHTENYQWEMTTLQTVEAYIEKFGCLPMPEILERALPSSNTGTIENVAEPSKSPIEDCTSVTVPDSTAIKEANDEDDDIDSVISSPPTTPDPSLSPPTTEDSLPFNTWTEKQDSLLIEKWKLLGKVGCPKSECPYYRAGYHDITTSMMLRDHWRSWHMRPDCRLLWQCPLCNSTFVWRQYFRLHVLLSHGYSNTVADYIMVLLRKRWVSDNEDNRALIPDDMDTENEEVASRVGDRLAQLVLSMDDDKAFVSPEDVETISMDIPSASWTLHEDEALIIAWDTAGRTGCIDEDCDSYGVSDRFYEPDALRDHWRTAHMRKSSRMQWLCPLCPTKKFSWGRSLAKHMTNQHKLSDPALGKWCKHMIREKWRLKDAKKRVIVYDDPKKSTVELGHLCLASQEKAVKLKQLIFDCHVPINPIPKEKVIEYQKKTAERLAEKARKVAQLKEQKAREKKQMLEMKAKEKAKELMNTQEKKSSDATFSESGNKDTTLSGKTSENLKVHPVVAEPMELDQQSKETNSAESEEMPFFRIECVTANADQVYAAAQKVIDQPKTNESNETEKDIPFSNEELENKEEKESKSGSNEEMDCVPEEKCTTETQLEIPSTPRKTPSIAPIKNAPRAPQRIPCMPFTTWTECEDMTLIKEWSKQGKKGCIDPNCNGYQSSENGLDNLDYFRDHWKLKHMSSECQLLLICPFHCHGNNDEDDKSLWLSSPSFLNHIKYHHCDGSESAAQYCLHLLREKWMKEDPKNRLNKHLPYDGEVSIVHKKLLCDLILGCKVEITNSSSILKLLKNKSIKGPNASKKSLAIIRDPQMHKSVKVESTLEEKKKKKKGRHSNNEAEKTYGDKQLKKREIKPDHHDFVPTTKKLKKQSKDEDVKVNNQEQLSTKSEDNSVKAKKEDGKGVTNDELMIKKGDDKEVIELKAELKSENNEEKYEEGNSMEADDVKREEKFEIDGAKVKESEMNVPQDSKSDMECDMLNQKEIKQEIQDKLPSVPYKNFPYKAWTKDAESDLFNEWVVNDKKCVHPDCKIETFAKLANDETAFCDHWRSVHMHEDHQMKYYCPFHCSSEYYENGDIITRHVMEKHTNQSVDASRYCISLLREAWRRKDRKNRFVSTHALKEIKNQAKKVGKWNRNRFRHLILGSYVKLSPLKENLLNKYSVGKKCVKTNDAHKMDTYTVNENKKEADSSKEQISFPFTTWTKEEDEFLVQSWKELNKCCLHEKCRYHQTPHSHLETTTGFKDHWRAEHISRPYRLSWTCRLHDKCNIYFKWNSDFIKHITGSHVNGNVVAAEYYLHALRQAWQEKNSSHRVVIYDDDHYLENLLKKLPAELKKRVDEAVEKERDKMVSSDASRIKTALRDSSLEPQTSRESSVDRVENPHPGLPYTSWTQNEDESLMSKWDRHNGKGCIDKTCISFRKDHHMLDEPLPFRDHWRTAHLQKQHTISWLCPLCSKQTEFDWADLLHRHIHKVHNRPKSEATYILCLIRKKWQMQATNKRIEPNSKGTMSRLDKEVPGHIRRQLYESIIKRNQGRQQSLPKEEVSRDSQSSDRDDAQSQSSATGKDIANLPSTTWTEAEDTALITEWEKLGSMGCIEPSCPCYGKHARLTRSTGFRDHWRSAHMAENSKIDWNCPLRCSAQFQWAEDVLKHIIDAHRYQLRQSAQYCQHLMRIKWQREDPTNRIIKYEVPSFVDNLLAVVPPFTKRKFEDLVLSSPNAVVVVQAVAEAKVQQSDALIVAPVPTKSFTIPKKENTVADEKELLSKLPIPNVLNTGVSSNKDILQKKHHPFLDTPKSCKKRHLVEIPHQSDLQSKQGPHETANQCSPQLKSASYPKVTGTPVDKSRQLWKTLAYDSMTGMPYVSWHRYEEDRLIKAYREQSGRRKFCCIHRDCEWYEQAPRSMRLESRFVEHWRVNHMKPGLQLRYICPLCNAVFRWEEDFYKIHLLNTTKGHGLDRNGANDIIDDIIRKWRRKLSEYDPDMEQPPTPVQQEESVEKEEAIKKEPENSGPLAWLDCTYSEIKGFPYIKWQPAEESALLKKYDTQPEGKRKTCIHPDCPWFKDPPSWLQVRAKFLEHWKVSHMAPNYRLIFRCPYCPNIYRWQHELTEHFIRSSSHPDGGHNLDEEAAEGIMEGILWEWEQYLIRTQKPIQDKSITSTEVSTPSLYAESQYWRFTKYSKIEGLPYNTWTEDEDRALFDEFLKMKGNDLMACPHTQCDLHTAAPSQMKNEFVFREHWLVSHIVDKILFQCSICAKTCRWGFELEEHFTSGLEKGGHSLDEMTALIMKEDIITKWAEKDPVNRQILRMPPPIQALKSADQTKQCAEVISTPPDTAIDDDDISNNDQVDSATVVNNETNSPETKIEEEKVEVKVDETIQNERGDVKNEKTNISEEMKKTLEALRQTTAQLLEMQQQNRKKAEKENEQSNQVSEEDTQHKNESEAKELTSEEKFEMNKEEKEMLENEATQTREAAEAFIEKHAIGEGRITNEVLQLFQQNAKGSVSADVQNISEKTVEAIISAIKQSMNKADDNLDEEEVGMQPAGDIYKDNHIPGITDSPTEDPEERELRYQGQIQFPELGLEVDERESWQENRRKPGLLDNHPCLEHSNLDEDYRHDKPRRQGLLDDHPEYGLGRLEEPRIPGILDTHVENVRARDNIDDDYEMLPRRRGLLDDHPLLGVDNKDIDNRKKTGLLDLHPKFGIGSKPGLLDNHPKLGIEEASLENWSVSSQEERRHGLLGDHPMLGHSAKWQKDQFLSPQDSEENLSKETFSSGTGYRQYEQEEKWHDHVPRQDREEDWDIPPARQAAFRQFEQEWHSRRDEDFYRQRFPAYDDDVSSPVYPPLNRRHRRNEDSVHHPPAFPPRNYDDTSEPVYPPQFPTHPRERDRAWKDETLPTERPIGDAVYSNSIWESQYDRTDDLYERQQVRFNNREDKYRRHSVYNSRNDYDDRFPPRNDKCFDTDIRKPHEQLGSADYSMGGHRPDTDFRTTFDERFQESEALLHKTEVRPKLSEQINENEPGPSAVFSDLSSKLNKIVKKDKEKPTQMARLAMQLCQMYDDDFTSADVKTEEESEKDVKQTDNEPVKGEEMMDISPITSPSAQLKLTVNVSSPSDSINAPIDSPSSSKPSSLSSQSDSRSSVPVQKPNECVSMVSGFTSFPQDGSSLFPIVQTSTTPTGVPPPAAYPSQENFSYPGFVVSNVYPVSAVLTTPSSTKEPTDLEPGEIDSDVDDPTHAASKDEKEKHKQSKPERGKVDSAQRMKRTTDNMQAKKPKSTSEREDMKNILRQVTDKVLDIITGKEVISKNISRELSRLSLGQLALVQRIQKLGGLRRREPALYIVRKLCTYPSDLLDRLESLDLSRKLGKIPEYSDMYKVVQILGQLKIIRKAFVNFF